MTPGFSSICEEGYVGSSKQTPAPDKNLTLTNISQSMPGPAGEPNLEQMEEQDNLSNGLPVSKSLFVDNQTIFAGFKHGLRAQTYSVRTKDGVLYEYSLENINEMPLIDACNDFRSVSRPMDNGPATTTNAATSKSTISSGPSVGAGADLSKWKQDPPCKDYDYTSTLFAEIVSGTGFEGRKVFVSYEMLVPTGTGDTQWQLRKGNLVDGVVAKDIISSYYQEDTKPTMSSTTNLFGTNKDNYSGVQNPLIMRNMLDNKDSEGALHGSTHVAVNKQIYGRYALGCGSSESGQNSTEMFKYSDLYPEHFQILGKNMTETTRLILGSCFFVFSCLSVTLGLSSPCWIIPCVVIFMVLGMGMPGGGDILVMNNQRKKLNDNETVRRVISHTNTSEVYNIPASTCLTDPVAHFNHLINVSFDVKCNRSSFTENKVNKDDLERFKNIKAEMGCTSDSIIVVFEVYSLGWFGRCTTEGYGYVSIPLYGKIDTEIKTWKPLGSLSSRVYEYYMGGSSALHNNRFVGIPNPKQRSINRYGVVTEASGTLRFRANMTRSDPRSMVSADEEEKQRRQQTLKVRKTVDDILTNFKATGSVSSNAINKTLLRASASKDQISSMNSSKLGSLLHRAGSPSGGASVSASATGLPTNIKEIVKDNSR